MRSPPPPINELEHLAVVDLFHSMNAVKEDRFQRLVDMAKSVFDVDICLITLLDAERQWFKACVGLQIPGTERSVSFCGHAIQDDAIFVVEDALADPRFRDNPLVTGPPFIRFYAGAPLVIAEEVRIGTLCVIHTDRRTFSETDACTLRQFADIARDELLRRPAPTPREVSSERQKLGLDGWLQWLKQRIS